MGFGPFLSQEEKDRINAAHYRNYGKHPNLYKPGVTYGEDVDPNTGKSIPRKSQYHQRNYQPGKTYGEDVKPAGKQTNPLEWLQQQVNGLEKNTPQWVKDTAAVAAPLVTDFGDGSAGLAILAEELAKKEKPSGSGRPKASGTVITIDGKRYDTGYHAEEIAALRKKHPGGGNAGQAQSLDPNKSSYIPPTEKSSSTPPTPPTPTTPPASTERTNENGITQKGKVLSSSDMASLGLMDASRFWDSEIAAGDAAPSGSATININGKPYELSGEDLVEYQEAQTELGGDPRTAPLVPQPTSQKPAAPGTPWSKVELTEEDEAYVSPMYANAARNAARSAFLDAPAGQGALGAINARNRAVGGDYENGFNVGGKNYQWADGVDQRQKSAAMYALSGGAGNT